MLEFLSIIFGMCLIILPVLTFFNYLLLRVSKKTEFDCHVKRVRDKKGCFGVLIAYLNRIFLFMLIVSVGFLFLEQFANNLFLKTSLLLFVLFIVVNYFDICNEK